MPITIYNKVGNPKVELSPNDSSIQATEIQGDSVLTLSFTHYEHIDLDVDDYADFEGERYWLTEKYRPKQKSTKEWSYDIKLYGVESMIKRLLVIKTVDNEDEPVFTLTAPPREHVAMIVHCMNRGMGNISDWKVGQVDGTENIVIDYFGKHCDQALKEIAEKVGTEWWVEGQTVNICKCEHGEPIVMGYDKGLTGIEPTTADNVDFYTRLYPVGSSRNIDREKYGYTRLQLPGGQKYVEMNAEKYGRVDHYEADAFTDIYPRRIGVVSRVRSEVKTGEDGKPFTIYYFRDDSLPFNPNEYEIGGIVKRVSFQDGSELAGLGDEEDGTYYFEVNYNSDAREFEIITIWPYDDDTQLPGGTLVPKAGDKYILWNLRMPDEYYALAEEEFLAAVNKYNADHNLDLTVYKASTDNVWIEDNGIDLSIGRRVRLESKEYFPESGYRDSRITRITRKVNLPSQMEIEIGDALSRTSMQRISDSVSDAKSYARSIGESTGLPDIIRTWDKTMPTDNNLFSARRSQREFVSKNSPDRAKKKIIFDEGIDTGNYIAGERGSTIDGQGRAEVKNLKAREGIRAGSSVIADYSVLAGSSASVGNFFPGSTGASMWVDAQGTSHVEGDVFHVRRKLTAREVEIQKERHVGGAVILSPAGAVLTRVEYLEANSSHPAAWRCYFDGSDAQGRVVYNEFAGGDLVRCKTFALERQEDGMTGNRYWWRLCVATGTSHYVYDEKTGTRLENLCSEPRPAGVSVTADGYFKHADGSYTPLGEVPAAGEVVTLRIRGRFAKAREGDLWALTSVFPGGNWNAGVTVPAEGGVDNEVAEVTFAWPGEASEARMMIRSVRNTGTALEADPECRLTGMELVRGTSVSGEERTEHWIDVSPTDCDASVENSAPREGDEVHTVGNRTDPTRGNVVMLSAYDAGSGLAPCLVCYEKLDDYSFPAEKLTARLSPSGNFIRGEFKVRVGDGYMDVKDWATGMAEGYTNTQFNVLAERINSSVTEVKTYTNHQVQGVSDLLSSGLNTVQGNVDSLRQYVDGEYYDALTDILDGLENNIGSVSFRTSTLEQTAEAITERVVSVEADAAGLKQSVGELEVRSDRITAQVSTTRQAVPNLCATPFVDAVSSAASGYFAAGTYFALTEEIEAGATVTVRLRGRFYPGGVVTVYAGSWSMGGVLSTEKPIIGGIDNEEVVGTFTASASGEPGKKLIIQTGKYIDGQWHYSGDCNLKYIAVVRGAVMPQAYREEDALGDALLPTGIDIRERKVKITADNFEVENNSGKRTMLVDENGQITATLIDADSITARRVEAGAKGGERVVIDPAEKSVAVYDSEGRQCTVLDGTRYTSGPASLGDFGAFDSIDIGPLAGGRWTSANKLPGTRTYTSGDLQFAAGTVRVSGTVAVSARLSARPATETDDNGLAVNIGAQYAQVTATLTLTVGTQTFAIGEETLKLQHGGLAAGGNSYPAQEKTNTLNLGSKTVNIAAAGTGRLTLTLKNTSDCKAGMYSTGAEWTLAMGKMETRYISRYFANGLILGSSTSRYFAAWHGADGYMNFETRNDSAGLRLTKNGAYMLGPEGSWHPLYSPLGFFYIEPVAGSTAVNVSMSGGGSLPAPTAVSSGGTITLTFGQAWADAGISIQQAWPRITPTKGGSAIAMTAMTANTMSFATTDNGVATPVRFFMELVLTHN